MPRHAKSVAIVTLLLIASAPRAGAPKAHVLAILADGALRVFAALLRLLLRDAASDRARCRCADFGWSDSGWHAEAGGGDDEVARTPNMDKLVETGARNNTHKFCAFSGAAAAPEQQQRAGAAAAAARRS